MLVGLRIKVSYGLGPGRRQLTLSSEHEIQTQTPDDGALPTPYSAGGWE